MLEDEPKGKIVFKGQTLDLLVGLVFTVVAGYLAIVLVKKLVLNKKFHYFAAYSLFIGVILIALSFLGL